MIGPLIIMLGNEPAFSYVMSALALILGSVAAIIEARKAPRCVATAEDMAQLRERVTRLESLWEAGARPSADQGEGGS